MNISVVIPAFNEADKLPGALTLLEDFLEGSGAGLKEVVVVDDGSTDGTAEAAESLGRPEVVKMNTRVRVLRHPVNRGKGAAVRTGVMETTGDVVILTDADGNYLHNRAGPFLETLCAGADIVLASRYRPGSSWDVSPSAAPYIRRRRAMGRTFNTLVRLVTGLPVTDTQTGLKFFRGEVARGLFSNLVTEGFAYDVEILCRARRRGFRIRELPFVYRCPSAESKVTFWDPAKMLVDVLRVPCLCRGERADICHGGQ